MGVQWLGLAVSSQRRVAWIRNERIETRACYGAGASIDMFVYQDIADTTFEHDHDVLGALHLLHFRLFV
jgi:hypothetical protein